MEPDRITSRQHPLVKELRALRQRKHRQRSALVLVEGVRLAEEAVASSWEPHVCVVRADSMRHDRVIAVAHEAHALGARLVELPEGLFGSIAETQTPQGILLAVRSREWRLEDLAERLSEGGAGRLVVLDRVQDPGNVGTILRTAEAAGCLGVLLTEGCADPLAPKTLRASMGAVFQLPVVSGLDAETVVRFLRGSTVSGVQLVAMAADAPETIWEADLRRPSAFLLGNEGAGLDPDFERAASLRVRIPIFGRAESLNVAASAALALFEAARQGES